MNDELDERKQSTTNDVMETSKEVIKNEVQSQVKKKAQETLTKEAAKAGAKATSKVALSGSGLAVLGPILFWALIIIIAIIIIVGIIMFFMTMPGMVTEKLKNFATSFVKQIASFYGADTTTMVEDEEKYEVLDYLEQMGYDLKGYGFISKNADSEDANYDKKQGVIRHADTGLIKEAYTDIIGVYLMSDNYVYTVKNFNKTGIWAYLTSILKTTHPIIWNFLDVFVDETAWGRGLITLKFEDDRDYQKNLVDQMFGTNTSWLNIKINPEAKTMGIRRGWGANYYEYNLDGWTGRYGMPLEFLLSVHIATMKPDLTYEMVTTFDTNIDMRLKDVGGKIDALYKNSSGTYISYKEVEELIHIGASDDPVTAVLNWFDDWNTSEQEIAKLFGLGFEHVCAGTEDVCDFTGEEVEVTITDENGNQVPVTYTKAKNISQACKDNILEIIKELKNANDYNFDTYVPYIKKVENHWFRDVYFMLTADEVEENGIKLTRTDIDYEKMTNERWTEYEKYESGDKIGEYVLYIYDKNKSEDDWEVYPKSKEEADKEGITVVKKQVKTYATNLEQDGLLTLKDDGSWSAYEIKNTSSESYQRLWPEENESTIKGRIYYKETMDSNIVQKYDGLRGVTNPTIKEMFLTRNYFSYDGTGETADIIKKIRDDVLLMKYGSIDDSDLDTEFNVTIQIPDNNGEFKEKSVSGKIGDYTSNVSITQDSLAAFSMLENTHTQDADFIYKDFKELIVELGYFEKEDLSDGRKRLLQWLIPEIGSAGYPKRALDKRENDYGTLAHSKEDYEINEKNTIAAMLEEFYNTQPEVPETVTNNANNTNNLTNNPQLSAMNRDLYTNLGASVDQFIGEQGTKDSSLSGISVQEFLEAGQMICEYMDQVGYDYCVYSLSEECTTCQTSGRDACNAVHCSHTVKNNSCGLPITFEESKSLTNVCCATLVSWVLREVGVNMDACPNQNSAQGVAKYCVEQLGGKVITNYDDLEPGDILAYVRTGGNDIGHVDILAEKSGDGFKKYNGGHPISSTQSSINDFNEASFNSNDLCFGIRLFGNVDEGAVYEGYRGNEAVVSPVTGILLEYGTYTDEDAANGYRKNLDMPEETDKVGYAKILVLNEEVGDQLVSCTKHGSSGKVSVNDSEIKNTDKFDELSEDEKALYGYKLFKEEYEAGKIDGYLLYIDGFKCELPGEVDESTLEDENSQIEITTPGETLSMEYFKEKAAKGSGTNFVPCTYEQTLYEPEEVYNLISDELEEKQKAEIAAKENATLLYSFTGILDGDEKDLLIIKEGTVIGRTLTDKELVESEEYRNDTYITKEDAIQTITDPETGETKEVDTREVRGNYLRILMRDLDDTVVENVEDYMKLDEVDEYEQNDWELFFWLPFESGGTDIDDCGPESQSDCSPGETAVGLIQWTVLARDYHDDDKDPSTPTDEDNGDAIDMNNIANQFISECLKRDSSLCSPLAAFQDWTAEQFWLDYDNKEYKLLNALREICDVDREAFITLQMEIAKDQYLKPILDANPWLAERRSCVQGAVMHLAVWGADYSWISSYESKTDEEIILKVRNTIANTSSTAGEATGDETKGRAYNEPEIALRILSGDIDTNDIEQWVRKYDTSVLGFDLKY